MIRLTNLSRLAAAATLGGSLALPLASQAQDAPPPPAAGEPAAQPASPGPALAQPAAPLAPAEAGAPPAPGEAAAPPPGTAATDMAPGAADPPARAGRVARVSGTVSFHGPGADHWDPATMNFPVTSGDALWTEPGARAAVDVASNRISLGSSTELDVDTLDSHALVATEAQGEIYVRVRRLSEGETYTVRTPRGVVAISSPGHFAIAAGDTQTPTTITAVDGAAQITAPGVSLTVQAGQTATITGSSTFQGRVGPETRDAFLSTMLTEDEHRLAPAAQAVAMPAEVAAMPGADDLAAYGEWSPTPSYGSVWYPRVEAGWVPYRHGRWSYVAPWGWTWVDEAPWGFAPFHYGRWVQDGGRWGWSAGYAGPGYVAPAFVGVGFVEPVYAPALVSFVGFGGVGIGIGIGGLGASVGWFPLGFGEVYHPWYHSSPGYAMNINRTYVSNTTNITNITNVSNTNYINRGAATVVPGNVMTHSAPVAGAVQPVTPQQLAAARPVTSVPVQPTATTAGMTPTVAHQLNVPYTRPPTAARSAPGPTIAPTPTPTAAHPPTGAPTGAAPGSTGTPALAPHTPTSNLAPRPATTGTPTTGTPTTGTPTTGAPTTGAPGPAIAPHPAGTPGAASVPGSTGAPGPAIAPHPTGTAAPVPALRPSPTVTQPHPIPQTGGQPAAGTSSPTTPQPVTPQVHTPTPAVTQPVTPQTHTPVPAAQPVTPQPQHTAPQPLYTPPAQHTAPPQPQHYTAPPQPQHYTPPPQPQHYTPPPQPQHYTPPPQPQRSAPPPAKSCPPNHPNC